MLLIFGGGVDARRSIKFLAAWRTIQKWMNSIIELIIANQIDRQYPAKASFVAYNVRWDSNHISDNYVTDTLSCIIWYRFIWQMIIFNLAVHYRISTLPRNNIPLGSFMGSIVVIRDKKCILNTICIKVLKHFEWYRKCVIQHLLLMVAILHM